MFTNATKYAIRTVLFLAKDQPVEDKKYRVVDLAEELAIPKQFLSKVLQKLTKAKLISATKGRNGGFFLTEQDLQNRLLDIIVCIEGENIFDNCILGLHACSNENPCELHHYFVSFKDQINEMIQDISIGDIIL